MSESIRFKIAHGTYVPERLPPGADRAIEGSFIATGENICRRCHEAVLAHQAPEYANLSKIAQRRAGRFKVNRIVRPAEEFALREWVKRSGLWLDNSKFTHRWELQGYLGETEHEIYFDETSQRWFKRNNLTYHGTWLEYFHRLALHNWLFPATGVIFEGILDNAGHLMPVISQQHVRASRGATRTHVASAVKRLGFEPVNDRTRADDYINQSLGVEIADLHDENVLIGEGGLLYFIDPIPMMDETSKLERLQHLLDS